MTTVQWFLLYLSLANPLLTSHTQTGGQFVNVAVNGVATQVSTVDDQEAQLALDDDPTTCSQTREGRGAWWKVDLGSERIITTIDLTSSSSLENLSITVSSSPDDEGNVCFYYDPKTTKEDTIQCYRPMLGRYVTITLSFRKSLILCSVRVNECEDEYFGNSCRLNCHCVDNDPCDKSTGSCPIGCSAGYLGDDCQEECSRGKFGLQCQKNCHCAFGVACEPRDGRCPVECAQNWLGDECQTEFPRLLSPPVASQNQIEATAITLSWYRWNGHIDARYQLVFHVLYRQYRGAKNKSDRWLELSPLVQTSDPTQTATIGGLEYNTRYEFKLIPYMLDGTEEIKGKPSPISQPIKTKCTAPEAPKIHEDDIFVLPEDASAKPKAQLTVRWSVVSEKALRCDSLLYYEVMYQKEGSHEWLIRKSKDEEYNITGLDFNTAYRIKVAAINNELLRAGSGVRNVNTHKPPDSSSRSSFPTWAVGVVICGLLVTGIIFVVVFRLCRVKQKEQATKGTRTHAYEEIGQSVIATTATPNENIEDGRDDDYEEVEDEPITSGPPVVTDDQHYMNQDRTGLLPLEHLELRPKEKQAQAVQARNDSDYEDVDRPVVAKELVVTGVRVEGPYEKPVVTHYVNEDVNPQYTELVDRST